MLPHERREATFGDEVVEEPLQLTGRGDVAGTKLAEQLPEPPGVPDTAPDQGEGHVLDGTDGGAPGGEQVVDSPP